MSKAKQRVWAIFQKMPDGLPTKVVGREAWALLNLKRARKDGCTALEQPAVRWAAYIHDLRHNFGLDIESIHESHKGPFPGTHCRYVLRSDVTILETSEGDAS
ncbi:winged helix domain-containing protein [Aminobacter sp. LjRoot7]|uniref:winged helix domain-containing protein n=1 Tax=Aminobacter sp. LjRoot7 TaxID=3342335 RepID=UPI003ED1695B